MYKLVSLLTLALISVASIGEGALISIAATAASTQQTNRPSERVADGLTFGPSIYLVGGGDPDDAADYRLDATVNNDPFGQVSDWMSNAPGSQIPNQWLSVDLGQDFTIEDLGFFNFAVTSGDNTDRGVGQADIYYRTDASGAGNNVDGDGGPFDPTGWTLLGTAGTQIFSPSVAGSTANTPDVIGFGGATARYIALDINSNLGDTGFVGVGEVMVFRLVPEPSTGLVLAGLAMCCGCTRRGRRARRA